MLQASATAPKQSCSGTNCAQAELLWHQLLPGWEREAAGISCSGMGSEGPTRVRGSGAGCGGEPGAGGEGGSVSIPL
eukprot:gene9154-biopygen1559